MILDTNVVSEPLQTRPNQKVVHWLDSLDRASCNITTITAAELLSGLDMIAAIAMTNNMTVASRDTSPFLYAGADVINPWTDEFPLQPGRQTRS